MSFMFRPFPYADPKAVNPVRLPEALERTVKKGAAQAARMCAERILEGKLRLGIEPYPGTELEPFLKALKAALQGTDAVFIDAAECYLPPEAVRELLLPFLPEDREADPVLLYGVRYEGGHESLMDSGKVQALKARLQEAKTPVVVYGQGALCDAFADLYDTRLWADITPRTAAINFKTGNFHNVGAAEPLPFNLMMRRNYYVDFELAVQLRWERIRQNKLDLYMTADDPENVRCMPFETLKELFACINQKPFRCRPVYLEGVWGGFYIYRLRNLPREMKNCAWVFDMIPMEVSLAAQMGETEIETPFFTYVQVMGEKLLGQRAFERFGGYFPIRFNYDDTFHASGNMSIQCHPGEDYVVKNHHELGRQDESYYVCVASNDAKTYLGFEEEESCDAFFEEAHRAEKTHEQIDYQKYIHAEVSKPGLQVMIPAGTVHASGRNQVILEIGSLTVGSYTYKLYDYQRIDPATGEPRPIHLKMGSEVIRPERTAAWVKENLVNHGGLVRQGKDWKEIVVGEHDLLYFSLRNLIFDREIQDDTKGDFHVLALTDGEKIRIESRANPELYFDLDYLELAVVPAYFGEYTVRNLGVGTVTVHKTLLKAGA